MSDSVVMDRQEVSPSVRASYGIVPRSRYRHPGDALRFIGVATMLLIELALVVALPDQLIGSSAGVVTVFGAATPAGRLLIGIVQIVTVTAMTGVAIALLVTRRYRLLASLAGAALVAWMATNGLMLLLDVGRPTSVLSTIRRGSWLTVAGFPSPATLGGAAAVVVAVAPWLNRPWRRASWLILLTVAVTRIVAGTVAPTELILALSVGATVGTGLLLLLGAPDRRLGPTEIRAALIDAGLALTSVTPANVTAHGSRPFVATTSSGEQLFVKALGTDQRDADLLYRLYRWVRLRRVGDTWPAASLVQAVEHQALVGVMAERAGVTVPPVRRLVTTPDGSALLVMDLIDGQSLDRLSADEITDELLVRVWEEVDRLHRAGIAHRSMRSGNILVQPDGRPRLVDFSFSELVGTERQMALDVAELLASSATVVGAERAVEAAATAIGPRRLASAVPLLQPLALSAATRRAIADHEGLLTDTRSRTAAITGRPPDELAHLYRVRPRTLIMVAVAAGAFYFLLPKLAQVGGSWEAIHSAHWAWVPVVVAMSALTYLAAAFSSLGSVPVSLPYGPTVLTASASSFVNRVSPANVGGMALNVRYLQKCGMEPGPAVAATGLDSFAGLIVHVVLIVVFFAWAGANTAKAFSLPSSSTLLVVLAALAAAIGLILATRWGRHRVLGRVLRELRASAASLGRVAHSPVRIAELFGGSVFVTLFYIAAFAASVQAFGGGISLAQVGAVYLGASAIAAAAPTPGGLGPLEAALVAGLTGVGLAPGPAVSAVLVYRLATYWLPVLPGWVSLHLLQRKAYL